MPICTPFRALCLKCRKIHTLCRGDVIGLGYKDGRIVDPERTCPICGRPCITAEVEPFLIIILNKVLALGDWISKLRNTLKQL